MGSPVSTTFRRTDILCRNLPRLLAYLNLVKYSRLPRFAPSWPQTPLSWALPTWEIRSPGKNLGPPY
ncbi:uncharacterized protein CCOS01_08740 [Colletotrichum costaricense]|uniref:Uncharacterized protein n=1 Tax=Colletotrichum costaricense TaxID=1209916 RepID=A0AAI9YWA8_9PEZI|nr:uncharacterized protein CCOS01_08740 [Colletotrichum costaricense]KAK1526322.1 hypothetical protein CCOS01_08740 [Colletotrichum costaricense]